jgi:hypothetical protein
MKVTECFILGDPTVNLLKKSLLVGCLVEELNLGELGSLLVKFVHILD